MGQKRAKQTRMPPLEAVARSTAQDCSHVAPLHVPHLPQCSIGETTGSEEAEHRRTGAQCPCLLTHREPEKLRKVNQTRHLLISTSRITADGSPASRARLCNRDYGRPSPHRDHHPDGDTHPAGMHQRTTAASLHCALSDKSVSHCEWPGTMKQVPAPTPKHQ